MQARIDTDGSGVDSREAGARSTLAVESRVTRPDRCPVCAAEEWNYVMNAHGLTFFSCENCGLMRLHPLPSAKTLRTLRAISAAGQISAQETPAEELQRARSYWSRLKDLLGSDATKKKILLYAGAPDALLRVGRELEFQNIEVLSDVRGSQVGDFDACMAVFALERANDPAAAIGGIHRSLHAGGKLLLVVPLMNSWPARVCRDAWTELRPETRFYFSTHTLRSFLLNHGFDRLWLEPDRRRYSIAHLQRQAQLYPATWLTKSVRAGCAAVPRSLRSDLRLPVPTSSFVATATKSRLRERKKLSIVMPVYNERETFEQCFQAVRNKEVEGVEKEIIVVESNSSDGTHELVKKVCAGDGITVIFQDRAAGKGHAVRAGLAVSQGDLVLIQDADLEYDVNDYDELVKPILNSRAAFVLGSRHTGSWKMRRFNDQPLIAIFFNLGHLFFCTSLNLLFGQRLKDPFTMFKVFHKDCIYGLEFECDRFDFDFEILIKLIRKGYRPVELPVNYRARSLNEGKKVTAFRDPLTWLRALIKYRLCSIAPPRP